MVTRWPLEHQPSQSHSIWEKEGRGKVEAASLPFKKDFLGTPSKKRTTLAFVSLASIGHGASIFLREIGECGWCSWYTAVPVRAVLERKKRGMDIVWANINFLICLPLICQVSKLRPRE